ncbi:hypothetical protein evm_003503 [Chilo suppressalis]|nr:hypothetical protein evm_003503 [Chilo suppressalis]
MASSTVCSEQYVNHLKLRFKQKGRLHVGAPKAKSRTVKGIAPGLVFSCPLTDVDSSNASCDPLGKNDSSNHLMRSYIPNDFYKDDMWFGAVIAVVPKDKLLICAPREMAPYKDKHILINGVCYIRGKNKEQGLYPLRDEHRQAYRTDGARKEYGEYGYHLNYFAYGQAGMSVAVTKNSSIIIGAPGVLQWTGTIVDYKYSSNMFYFPRVPTMNPYHTLALGPDDYFGYSVESGVFEETGIILNVAGAPRSGKGYGQVLLFEPTTRETDPLKIKAQLIGPQLGSYFGASLCAVDIDGDGLSDLLVGAPNYAKRDGIIKYDQGAVFIYMSRKEDFRFVLSESGHVMGSRQSGARFGTTIADLGDVDSDGFNDVVIGAPWEDNGAGAVYIYRGSEDGLRAQYTQRIHAEGAKSFGISVSKGYDVDNNECNDTSKDGSPRADHTSDDDYRSVTSVANEHGLNDLQTSSDMWSAHADLTADGSGDSGHNRLMADASVDVKYLPHSKIAFSDAHLPTWRRRVECFGTEICVSARKRFVPKLFRKLSFNNMN